MEPPTINIFSFRIDHAIVKDCSSTIKQQRTEMLKGNGHIAFKGGDRIPEVDPEIHRTGAPCKSELSFCSFNTLGDETEKKTLLIGVLCHRHSTQVLRHERYVVSGKMCLSRTLWRRWSYNIWRDRGWCSIVDFAGGRSSLHIPVAFAITPTVGIPNEGLSIDVSHQCFTVEGTGEAMHRMLELIFSYELLISR